MENLNPLEATILAIIEGHRGKENAVPRTGLVDRVNLHWPMNPVDERKIRITMKHLTTQHGIAIGSCHGGYFIVETEEELQKVTKYYRSYALTLLFTESKLRKVHIADLLGQIKIQFDKECRNAGGEHESVGN